MRDDGSAVSTQSSLGAAWGFVRSSSELSTLPRVTWRFSARKNLWAETALVYADPPTRQGITLGVRTDSGLMGTLWQRARDADTRSLNFQEEKARQ